MVTIERVAYSVSPAWVYEGKTTEQFKEMEELRAANQGMTREQALILILKKERQA